MLSKIILPTILLLLAFGFWISPDFKVVSAGVAIFLFGMLSLEEGFKAFTGGLLENLLKRTTDKTWKALSFGVISTTIMQSSSLVSVITISFLSAGIITLTAGIGIIFGANLGTTTGAWLVAALGLKINISAYAMPMIVFGIVLVFQDSKKLKGIGYVLSGLGFLFLGIHYMKEGFEAFKDNIDLAAYAVDGYLGILLFTLIGMIATVIMQSSHATLVLIITALAAQQITYENALALAIGANLGTTVTALLGAIGANVDGRRLAAAHLVFNLITAMISIVFLYQLMNLVDWISTLMLISNDNYTLKLAIFHTVFNTIGIIVMLPVIGLLVEYLEKTLTPYKHSGAQPHFLNHLAAELPDTAIEAVRNELFHLYDKARDVIAGGLYISQQELESKTSTKTIVKQSHNGDKIDVDEAYSTTIKELYASIVEFISSVKMTNQAELNDELFALRGAGRDIVEAVKSVKHLQKNFDINIRSRNPVLQNEYKAIRFGLSNLLRELNHIRNQSDDESHILALDEMRLEMKSNDAKLNERLEELIRNRKISPRQATSLMNDNNYANEVTKKLVEMAGVLFSKGDISLRVTERELALSVEELDDIDLSTIDEQKGKAS